MDKQREWASEKIISEKINMLSNMVDYATKFDMTLCLENLSCKYDSFVKFFNEIPDLKMTMEVSPDSMRKTQKIVEQYIL